MKDQLFCEFCGSGPECGICGRGHDAVTTQPDTRDRNLFNLQVRRLLGKAFTTVRYVDPDGRPFRLVTPGEIRCVDTLAYALDHGKTFRLKYLDKPSNN